MNVLAAVVPLAMIIAAVALVLVLISVLRRRVAPGDEGRARREPVVALVQGALVVALLVALAVFVTAAVVDGDNPGLLGLPIALAPGLATSAGLAVVALTPRPRRAVDAVRSATLEPRDTWSVGTRRASVLPSVAAGLLVVLLLVTASTASADDAGRLRALTVSVGAYTSTSSPYPGWFYAAPLLAVTLVLLATALLAVHRIADLPALPNRPATEDGAWRRAAVSAVSLLATSGLLTYLGGCLLFTGSSVRSAGTGTALEPLGWVLLCGALLSVILACVCIGFAIAAAATFSLAMRRVAAVAR